MFEGNKMYDPKNILAVKHGGRNIMLWWWGFFAKGTGQLHHIKGQISGQILGENLSLSQGMYFC